MGMNKILETLSSHKEELRRRFHISKIGVFGSFAKGTQTEDSDIDILFETEEDATLGLKETYELEEFLKELFEVERVDLVNQKYINPIIELDIQDTLIYFQ